MNGMFCKDFLGLKRHLHSSSIRPCPPWAEHSEILETTQIVSLVFIGPLELEVWDLIDGRNSKQPHGTWEVKKPCK